MMRAILCLLPLAALMLGGCQGTEKKLKDVSFGPSFEADYLEVLDNTRHALRKEFPRGLDPDRSDEDAGIFWTIWHYKKSVWYRGTTRQKAHVVVEDLGDGQVRIGVSVVQQLNDDIDNPSIIEEARWTNAQQDHETAQRIENRIAKRYLRVKPSKTWEEKHRDKPSGTLRSDIIDRNRDVDLEEDREPGDREGLPSVTGREDFWDPLKKKKDGEK